MKIHHLLILLLVVLTTVSVAQDEQKKKRKKGKRNQQPQQLRAVGKALASLELTDEQKAKVKKITAEYAGKLREQNKAVGQILSADQRKAMAAARKTAQADGKKGKALQQAIAEAAKLTDEQKTKRTELQKKTREMVAAYRKAIAAVLTPEQLEKSGLNKKRRNAKKKKKKKKKDN